MSALYDGTTPAADEVEVTLFGPGYGEAIAVHLGEGIWLLVDSCINPDTKQPASLEYLEHLNISPDAVCSIIASHWHDDHVKGMTKLVEKFTQAEFVISGVFNVFTPAEKW